MRERRKKSIDLTKVDLMKPLKFEDFGSANDPCFGKHYSPKATECKRCGDADICSILSQQKLHLDVAKQEKKYPFKDVDEANLVDEQNKKLRGLLRKKGKATPSTWLSFSKLVPTVRKRFNLT